MASKRTEADQTSPQQGPAMNGGGQSAQSASAKSEAPAGPAQDAATLLKADHREVEKMFAEYEKAGPSQKDQLIRKICTALTIHTMLEEEIFYPACRDSMDEADPLNEAQVEHDSVKLLLADLWSARRTDRYRDAKVKVVAEQVKHHVTEEEQARTGIFAKAEQAGVDMAALGKRIAARKAELEARGEPAPGKPVAISGAQTGNGDSSKENTMPNMQQSRSGGDDRGSRGGLRVRDDDGRFTSSRRRDEDDDDRRSRSSRSRDDDDGERGSRSSRSRDGGDGRGRGGWFGDSRGHSEASRRGWDDRGSSRSSRHDDDDRRGRSGRSRDEDDGRGRGWFGDSRGHSEAARRGWDDRGPPRSSRDDDNRGGRSSRSRDDHGRGGWFDDSRGHSDAARRSQDDHGSSRSSRDDDLRSGRMSRSRDDDDRGGRFSRSRGDDDRRLSRGGRDDGRGWFGDSRGHSEAARRGWESRH